MDILSEYLMNDYVDEKEQLKSVNEIIGRVIPTYGLFNDEFGWGYEFTECKLNNKDKSVSTENKDKSVSTSTLAMIAFSMKVLKSGISDLNHKNVCNDIKSHYLNLSKKEKENDKDRDKENFDNILEAAIKLLFEEYKKGDEFKSGTYGINDPFTRVWAEHLSGDTSQMKRASVEYVTKIFNDLYCDREKLNFTDDANKVIEPTHIFPLLKVVQLYAMLNQKDRDCIERMYVKGVKSQLMNCLFSHLSLVDIENSNFDTAELVFSLEGILLLDENRENFDKNLLKRVFSVIKERQAISMYWRPLKPFVMNNKGLALLPLSVEIAMSLIRICRMLGKYGESLFTEYLEIFNSYTEWLKTRMNIVSCNKVCSNEDCGKTHCFDSSISDGKFYGWCSEHVHQPGVIHLWETSQVIIYLVNFNSMLQKHIARRAFNYAKFSVKEWIVDELEIEKHGHDKKRWDKWLESEPLKQDKFVVYKDIGHEFILNGNQLNSMLLYGPPGTGKSTIAEEIARAKGWPLVTITPSDFIANGADQVESKAKNIFKVLEEQEDIVVLFDEIDRLILDRDTKEYLDQSDIFQFMTPSMLVKIKDLRTRKRIIFIIATNYEERIDMAIKRAGRIDVKYLVVPPDKEGRDRLFDKFIKNKFTETDIDKYKDQITEKTALFTFTEFQQLSDTLEKNKVSWVNQDNKVILDELYGLIEKPAISIVSCGAKIMDENRVQKPFKEFLALIYLKAESFSSRNGFTEVEENCISEVFSLMTQKPTNHNLIEVLRNVDEIKVQLSDYINDKMIDEIISVLEKSKGSEG